MQIVSDFTKSSRRSPNHRIRDRIAFAGCGSETGLPNRVSEKKAKKCGVQSVAGRFLQCGFVQEIAELGHISRFSAAKYLVFSALQTAWRRGGDSILALNPKPLITDFKRLAQSN